ncbi:MAG: amidohydrolase family protein [Chloroflexota bacterium]|nr:amidohydrolase family protein [Chloroflexota bacterium]
MRARGTASGGRYDLVVNDAQVVNATGRFRGSVGVRGGVIAALSEEPLRGDVEVDAAGRALIPGVVDVHCHFRISQGHGPEAVVSSDDYVIGPRAAAFGGVTTFVDFAIQERGRSALDLVKAKIADAEAGSIIDFAFHCSLTDPRPEELATIEPVMDLGIASFKFFMTYAKWDFYVDHGFLLEAMGRIAARNGVCAVHAEDDEVVEFWRAKCAREDPTDMFNHSRSRPEVAEELAIRAAIGLAKEAGATLYVVHVSTARGLNAISEARRGGVRAIAETCPHYLAFTHDVYREPDGRYYTMTPPLRADGNRQALWAGVEDGSVSVVASDHNSFTREQKERATGFLDVPPGLAGSEMLLPYVLSEGVSSGRISLERAVEVLSTNPARIYHLPSKGSIAPGKDADLVLLDLDQERLVSDDSLHDPLAYTVFAGRRMRGWPVMTISRGEVIVDGDRCDAPPGRGRFIARHGDRPGSQ